MNLLTYKEYLKFRKIEGVRSIFDHKNKKWKKLLPEELVRQCLFQYLHHEKDIPFHMMKVEYSFSFIDSSYRADLIVLDKKENILLIAECKSFSLQLKQDQIDQVSLYNQKIRADWILLTNGHQHILMHRDKMNELQDLIDLPSYREMLNY